MKPRKLLCMRLTSGATAAKVFDWLLRDNAKQTLELNILNVKEILVSFKGAES